MQGNRRPFATGSKPGPDAVDHYLEEQGFYRKHIARDSSSLFRVVSEQVFDIQKFHEEIRQNCSEFMESHSKEYANEVDKNFYNYVSQLRRSRTHGSLLELRVMARMYKMNVILFEPTPNLQTTSIVYVHDDSYDEKNPMRVFFSPKDKHFDVIYTMDYVERLAECQSIVYNLLYSDIFKLPDVQYAVERMLHDQEEESTLPLPDDPTKYQKQSGEIISFESSEETNCVLKDPKTCHFHNQDDFEEIVNQNKDSITIINRSDEPGRLKIYKPIDGFLYDKSKSCVRQLLDERITPFPYKVAKALDPSIYRNTEFEMWSENRKEQRLKWLDSAEYPMKPHIDEKWVLYDRRSSSYRMRKQSDMKYEPEVVDENAYMALDEERKKKYIILDPAAEPFKLQHFTGFDFFTPSKESLELTVMPVNMNMRGGFQKKRGGGRFNGSHHQQSSGSYHHNQRHDSYKGHYERHQSQTSMPHVSEIERETSYNYSEQQEVQTFYQPQDQATQVAFQENCYEQQQVQAQAMYQPMPQQQGWNNQMMSYIPPPQSYQVVSYGAPLNYQQVMPYGNFSIPPPYAPGSTVECAQGDAMNIIREGELTSTSINWKPRESHDSNGTDLPLNEIPTLQFFFNLGVRYYFASGLQRQLESLPLQMENLEFNENTAASASSTEKPFENPKADQPPVPTNTPVTTKQVGGHYGPPGNCGGYQNNWRRPFSQNRDNRDSRDNRGDRESRGSYWNNSNNPNARKEIKFNSNVKNAHKFESKSCSSIGPSGSQNQMSQTSGTSLVATSTGNLNSEKVSPNNSATVPTPQYSPILSSVQDTPMHSKPSPHLQLSENSSQHQQAHQQYYAAPYPSQQQFVTPQMVYQIDDGRYMTPAIQYAQPYQYAVPQAQHIQSPYFYPMQPSYQPTTMDGSTMSSNDSGMVDPNSFQAYQQPIQYYPQYQPQQVYITAATSLPQTPQVAQIAPMFPLPPSPIPAHQVHAAQSAPAVNTQKSSSANLDSTVSANSDENAETSESV